MSIFKRSSYYAGVINPSAARILFIGFALLIPIMFSVLLVFVADPAQTPEQPAAEKVVEGLGRVFSSPLDFVIVWIMFAVTFLIGTLFFINKKYHYTSLLLILVFMSIANFYVIATAISPTGTIDFQGTLLAVALIIFGFALIPTLLPFLLGGGFVFMLASAFKQPNLRQESFGGDWNANFAKLGVRIWRPRLFFFSLYVSIVLFVMAWIVPATEGDATYMMISGVLLLTMGWMLLLVAVQVTFNITASGFRSNPFSPRRHGKQARSSRSSKKSIRDMRKNR